MLPAGVGLRAAKPTPRNLWPPASCSSSCTAHCAQMHPWDYKPVEKGKISEDMPEAARRQLSGWVSPRTQVSRDHGVSLARTRIMLALTHQHSLHFPTSASGFGRVPKSSPFQMLAPLRQAALFPPAFAGRNQCSAFSMLAAELCHQLVGLSCQVKQV